jgi:hypothetical protein
MKNFLEKFLLLSLIFSLISYYGFMASFGLSTEVLGLSSGFGAIFIFSLIRAFLIIAGNLFFLIFVFVFVIFILRKLVLKHKTKLPEKIQKALGIVNENKKSLFTWYQNNIQGKWKEFSMVLFIIMLVAFYFGKYIAHNIPNRNIISAQCISLFDKGVYLIPDISGGERVVLIPLDHEGGNNYNISNDFLIKNVSELNCPIQKASINLINLK